ncbi:MULTISPECIES: DUF6801 domain-containing protein [Streptomyces]|uniref:DUF6801 domain-containing protein n=1 Tax=Streptomyces ramulosus TaxID=47762 RepID=A0ABW1FDG1_9ACTN
MVALAATVAAAGAGAAPAAAAQAAPALAYTCQVPWIGEQRATARITTQIPGTVAVGVPSRRFPIGATTPVAEGITSLLGQVGVVSAEGTVTARIGVAAPQGDRRVPVGLTIPRTRIPASGTLVLAAHGTAPAMTFSRPGPGRLTAQDLVLHLVGRASDGSVRGVIDARCAPEGGQPAALASFTITRPPADPGPSPTSGPGPSRPADGQKPADRRPAPGPLPATGQDAGFVLLPAVGTLAAGVAAWWDGLRKGQDRS